MVIDFYYWGMQCPYNMINKEVLKSIQLEEKININYYDISKNEELTKKMNLFSPTLTVFDNKVRWSGPITTKLIKDFISGQTPQRKPYKVEIGKEIVRGKIRYLTSETCRDVLGVCSPNNCKSSCLEKGRWVENITNKYNLKNLGVLHFWDNRCVGGAEFIPSLEVPYNIPKDKDSAFLTCLYLSDTTYDYKSYPLEVLENELVKIDYKNIQVVASEDVAFPNGPLDWFIEKGYEDMGVLYYERNDGAIQHLLRKEIR